MQERSACGCQGSARLGEPEGREPSMVTQTSCLLVYRVPFQNHERYFLKKKMCYFLGTSHLYIFLLTNRYVSTLHLFIYLLPA